MTARLLAIVAAASLCMPACDERAPEPLPPGFGDAPSAGHVGGLDAARSPAPAELARLANEHRPSLSPADEVPPFVSPVPAPARWIQPSAIPAVPDPAPGPAVPPSVVWSPEDPASGAPAAPAGRPDRPRL